jgi:prepilin-type N-terminal cleavage/methylation domain-containing protein
MHRLSQRRGFTLTEVIIAVGIFSVVAVANFALFDLVLKDIRQVTNRDEAIRGASAFQDTLRQAGFETAYNWVRGDQELFAYHYRAKLTAKRADGSPEPYTGIGLVGADYRVVPALRAKNDPLLGADTAAKEGGLYRARLTLSKGNPLQTLPATAAEYKEPILVVSARFLDAPNAAAPQNAADKPLYTCTLSYLR